MEKPKLDYMAIQTDPSVWSEILKLNPIYPDEIFLEAFAGENSLYDQVQTNKKQWCEITKGRDIFDYDFDNSEVTCIYTNPPFCADIPDKKGNVKFRNAVFYFIELFMTRLKHLHTLGFLINAKSFCSLTPKRLYRLEQLGFYMTSITMLNCDFWYGIYTFIVFTKNPTNKPVKIIKDTFRKNIVS